LSDFVTQSVNYRKSSYSLNNGECVEVGNDPRSLKPVVIRDSKDGDGPRISASAASWRAFITQIKDV
jgi:hypothetical protein